MILYFSPHITENGAELLEDEFKHCCKVLRHVVGDEITITDGKGTKAIATIREIKKHSAVLSIQSLDFKQADQHSIVIAIAPPKNRSRWEWFVEKAVEIGTDEIIPLKTFHSERSKLNIERSQKIMRSAALQSQRSHHPHITEPMSLQQLLALDWLYESCNLIAHYHKDYPALHTIKPSKNKSLVLIGPEGDFSADELASCASQGFQAVKLSENRLRTETAGIVALSYLIAAL